VQILQSEGEGQWIIRPWKGSSVRQGSSCFCLAADAGAESWGLPAGCCELTLAGFSGGGCCDRAFGLGIVSSPAALPWRRGGAFIKAARER